MNKKTAEQFRKWMVDNYNLHADPEDQIKDTIMTLEWLIEKIEKESPHATNEIGWLRGAQDSLEGIANDNLYDKILETKDDFDES